MGGPTYTVEQLRRLRDSPLVHKPDGLPSIEQWMDLPVDQNNNSNTTNSNNGNRRPRSGVMRDSDSATTGENRSDRPLLINAGMGHFGRRASTHPEDTVLGPPKLSFTSASRTAKTGEAPEKRTRASAEGDPSDRSTTRERWTRDGDRNRDKIGHTNGRRTAPDEDGWIDLKEKSKIYGDEMIGSQGNWPDNSYEHKKSAADKADKADASSRRTGAGRDKFERWGRRDETVTKDREGNRFGGTVHGGWRDRERDREREKDRDWTRGTGKTEEDPEWMDTKVGTEKKQAHTQEDFQRWKELMRAKDAPTEEKAEPKVEQPATAEPSTAAPPGNAQQPPLPNLSGVTALADIDQGILFGSWGKDKAAEATASEAAPKAKTAGKKSRFQGMFAKAEEPTGPAEPTPQTPVSPRPTSGGSKDEDKEGFQRILQMLGGASIGGPPIGQTGIAAPTNGTRLGGGISLEAQHHPHPEDSPDRGPRQQVPRTIEHQNIMENILAPKPTGPEGRPSQARFSSMSPDASILDQFAMGRPKSNRPTDDLPIQQPPSRGSSAQDVNLQAILSARAREDANARDREIKQRERDFLLTLMQQPSRNTPTQMLAQNMPRPGPENQGMPPFFDAPPTRSQPQQDHKGRGMPPGFMEDPRMFPENEMMQRAAERRAMELREASMREIERQQEAMRKGQRGFPMGGPGPSPYHEDPMHQRRNTAGEVPRQMTNMGIPSQNVPDMPYMRGNPGMPQTPQERNIAPPPGFGAPVRQPPGFGGPQGGPPQQMAPFSGGNTPLNHPPGIPPPHAIFPGAPGGNMPPPGPPQSYFPPQGYGPPMPMQGRDGRMMGRPEFEQFGGPGQPGVPRQVGRPPNMY